VIQPPSVAPLICFYTAFMLLASSAMLNLMGKSDPDEETIRNMKDFLKADKGGLIEINIRLAANQS